MYEMKKLIMSMGLSMFIYSWKCVSLCLTIGYFVRQWVENIHFFCGRSDVAIYTSATLIPLANTVSGRTKVAATSGLKGDVYRVDMQNKCVVDSE